MRLVYTKTFKKQYKKLGPTWQDKCDTRIRLWQDDPTHPSLRVHPLQGRRAGYWSMNISGDLRALYYFEYDTLVVFALLGIHSQLY